MQWIAAQEDRFELVGGRIVRMMAGARQDHTVVTSNIVASLSPEAKRGGCRTTSSDTAVRTGPGGIRYPDVVVACGPRVPSATAAIRPVLVLEVSSPGTSAIDATEKLDEYRAQGDVRLILFVDPDVVSVKLYRRDATGVWTIEKYGDLGVVVDLSETGSTLSLADIYDTLYPWTRPRLSLVGD